MKKEKTSPGSVYQDTLDRLEKKLGEIGYSDDPRVLPRLINSSMYHKIRRRMYSGGMPPTLLELDKRFNHIRKNYRLLNIGFWSVYPILFASVLEKDVAKTGFTNLIRKYNRDVSEFFPYCAKCIFRVTIWPKVEIHSYPKGYIAIILESGENNNNEMISSWQKEWSKLSGFETFGVLPPMLIDIQNKKVLTPFSKSKFTKYPPSIKELSDSLFMDQ
jgi:hypothetical protein